MIELGRQFFTADTLFGDDVAAGGRMFPSVEAMNTMLIDRWNAVVKPHDNVWVLGNFHTANALPKEELVRSLNGSKYLVAGELDAVFHGSVGDPRRLEARRVLFEELGFTAVVTGAAIARKFGKPVRLPLRVRRDNLPTPVTVSAFAYDVTEVGDRFGRWRPKRPGSGAAPWLLHGGEDWVVRERQVCVSADAWGWEPVGVDVILDLIEDAES